MPIGFFSLWQTITTLINALHAVASAHRDERIEGTLTGNVAFEERVLLAHRGLWVDSQMRPSSLMEGANIEDGQNECDEGHDAKE
jgi:hypothetical protein